MLRRWTLVAALSLAGAGTSPAADSVWVVDAAGGGDFVEIADALPSTFQGGALLIRPGTYQLPVTLENHGITLIADGTGPVVLTEPLTIRGLGMTRDAIVSGLELRGGFEVESCDGLVRMQDCVVPQPEDAGFPDDVPFYEFADCGVGGSTQRVDDCRAVTFVGCEFHGADGIDAPLGTAGDAAPAHHGLWVRDASVALYDCVLTGGEGGDARSPGHFPVYAGAGGDGLRLIGDQAFARTCELQASGGPGGTFIPGGNGDFGVTFGCDGIDVRADPGSVHEVHSHPPISLDVPAIWRSDQPVLLRIEGPPGAGVFLVTASEPDWRPFPPSLGILHLLVPLQISGLGPVPPSGVLETALSDPGPGAPNEFVSLQLQVFGTQPGSRFLSNPLRCLVLDPGL